MFTNVAVLSILGFVFSTVAARTYPATSVGLYAGLTSGAQLLGMVAALGWSLTFVRFLPTDPNPRHLTLLMTATVVSIGGFVVMLVEVLVGERLFSILKVPESLFNEGLLLAMVLSAALGAVVVPGLLSRRALRVLVLANATGAIVRVVLLVPLARFGTRGLLGAFAAGTALGLLLSWGALWHSLPRSAQARGLLQRAKGYLRYSALGYVSSVLGTLPTALVPIVVLIVLGPVQAAWFAMAYGMASLLSFVPSTVAQTLFAEASNEPTQLRTNTRLALRGIYVVLVPAVGLTVLVAPLALGILGESYAEHGTAVLRLLAIGSLTLGGSYVVDALLASLDRMRSYVVTNLLNAVLIMGFVILAAPAGIESVARAWGVANLCSLIVGALVVVAPRGARAFRHRGVPETAERSSGSAGACPEQGGRVALSGGEAR